MTANQPKIEAARTPEPTPFPYLFRGNFHGDRKGQRCKVISDPRRNTVQIEFEDGFKALVTRYVLRRE
jgi:hypothetical protein